MKEYSQQPCLQGWIGKYMEGWMDRWMGGMREREKNKRLLTGKQILICPCGGIPHSSEVQAITTHIDMDES